MKRTADRLFGKQYKWSVLGAGRNQLAIAAQAAAMGGNVRVGLEDSLWAGPGKLATSNAEQVRAVRQIIEGLGLGRHARRGARDSRAEGRRQGRVLRSSGRQAIREDAMRIEVLIDVKTILGEGPLWDVEEQRLYFIDSFGCNVFRCTADGREVRAWDVPAKIGSMALRKTGRRGALARQRFSFPRFQDRRDAAHRRSRAGQARQSHQRRQGRQARPLRRRLHGHDGGRAQRRALPPRSRSLAAQARRRHHRIERALLEPRRPHVLFRRHLDRRNLGLRLRSRHRRGLQQAHVLQGRPLARRRGGRRDGRRRGLRLERAGLRRPARALYAGRQGRPRSSRCRSRKRRA